MSISAISAISAANASSSGPTSTASASASFLLPASTVSMDVASLTWLASRVRNFFYLSDPSVESFETVEQVTDYHTELFPLLAFFVFLEWLVLWLKKKPLPQLGDSAASTSMIVMMEVCRIVSRGLEHSAYFYIYEHYRIVELPWNSPFTWYLSAIFVDFCYYWGHRLSHEINFLWAQHQAHHSAETYSLVNVFRLPFTQDYLYAFGYLPIAIIVPPSHYLVHQQLNLMYHFWLHTDLIGQLGPLEWVFNTPTHHKVHHGSNKYCLDKNYGGWLIVWDRLFGTFQAYRPEEELTYGLVDSVQSFNPLYLQLVYVGKMYEKWNAMDGWKNKIYSLVKGPGWRPGSPWTGFLDEVPDVRGRKPYQSVDISVWQYAYMIVHFFLALITYEMISVFRHRLSPMAVFCHLAFILVCMTTTGMMVDGHRWFPQAEMVRCGFLLAYSLTGLPILDDLLTWTGLAQRFGPTLLPRLLLSVRLFFAASILHWSGVVLRRRRRRSKCD